MSRVLAWWCRGCRRLTVRLDFEDEPRGCDHCGCPLVPYALRAAVDEKGRPRRGD